jgi:hypothetical protein
MRKKAFDYGSESWIPSARQLKKSRDHTALQFIIIEHLTYGKVLQFDD